MNRVWKPLSVGGLRLYKVKMLFHGHPEWNKELIVAAKRPMHAAALIEEIYADSEWIVEPYIKGEALNILIPESWWEEGIPESVYIDELEERLKLEGKTLG